MFVETTTPRPARTPRRTIADRLREALLALAGGHGEVVRHAECAWASVTFAGARHRITLAFTGEDALAGGETLIAELSEHEFAIPGQLVADATVCAVEHDLLPQPHLQVECEMLLVEDA